MSSLDLGCGKNPRRGYKGIDIKDFGQEYVGDCATVLKRMDKGSINSIFASHFFEHLDQDTVIETLKECHRVLKKGGQLWIIVPHKDHERAHVLWHKTFFTEFTFEDYFTKWEMRELVTNDRMDIHCKVIKV